MERRLAAILVADVVGYSRLVGADEEGTLRTLSAYRRVIDGLVAEHSGRVFGSAGDSVIAEFASPVEAVRCAAETQRELEIRNAELSEDRRMRFRIGVNLGDVVVEGDDLLGDGVNIAARLETLSDPGGMFVSGTVFDQVEGKLDFGFDDLGAQQVKNIAKPVRVYRVRFGDQGRRAAAGSGEAPQLADKPSIAVLPFQNRSPDPEQEYFSDGIAEDINTRLSKVSSLYVISFNSSSVYRGRSATARQVSTELGARYVLDGSVRKAGNMVRISTELIDAKTGEQIWAEHYDRDLVNIFAVQDEVTEEIVSALALKLTPNERQRVRHTGTFNLEAHDYFLRGREKRAQQTEQTNAEAKLLFERALEADERFSAAAAYLSVTYGRDFANQWARPAQESLDLQVHWAERAVELDELEPLAHGVLAVAYLWVKRHDDAIAAAMKALDLNPNFAFAYMALGWIYHYVGEQQSSIELLEKAMRLDPHHPDYYFHFLAQAYFQMGRFDDAVATLNRRLERNPNSDISRVLLAASYGFLGKLDEARIEWRRALVANPEYSLEHRRDTLPYKDQTNFERIVEGLAKAGLPA